MLNLRPSRVLAKLRSGGVASCVKLNLSEPRVVEIASLCGFDCVWPDMEHVSNTLQDIEAKVAAARMHDVDVLVRVPRGSYSDMIRPLEVDAAGIMIPHVMTAEEARAIVQHTRFYPIGRRPLDGGNRDGAFTLVPMMRYLEHCNQQRMVVVQIEDPEALDELDAIAEIDGIDMLFFGPGDFAHGLGIPGQMTDSRIVDARRRVAGAAQRHGKFAGTVGSIDALPRLIEEGYRFVSVGADVVALSKYFRPIVEAFGQASSTPMEDLVRQSDRPY